MVEVGLVEDGEDPASGAVTATSQQPHIGDIPEHLDSGPWTPLGQVEHLMMLKTKISWSFLNF